MENLRKLKKKIKVVVIVLCLSMVVLIIGGIYCFTKKDTVYLTLLTTAKTNDDKAAKAIELDESKINYKFTLTNIEKEIAYRFLSINETHNDMVINDITCDLGVNEEQEKLIEYGFYYDNGQELQKNDGLKSGKRMPITLKFNYLGNKEELKDNIQIDGYCNIEYVKVDSKKKDKEVNFVKTGKSVQDLINEANVSTNYNDGDKTAMYTFKHEATGQVKEVTDYRYIGGAYCLYDDGKIVDSLFEGECRNIYKYQVVTSSENEKEHENYGYTCPQDDDKNTYTCEELKGEKRGVDPNNYVSFSGSVWRIIGVFPVENKDGEVEYRLKLVKDKGIVEVVDYSNKNIWSKSDLVKTLNKGTYWNSNGRYKDDGIRKEDKKYIEPAKYYLGGNNTSEDITAEEFYQFERGLIGRNGTTKEKYLSWVGNVGLMYMSDFYYTYANGVDNACFNDPYNCDVKSLGNPNRSWLYDGYDILTITPNSASDYGHFLVQNEGCTVHNTSIYGKFVVRPVIYLRADTILYGDGSRDNKYIVG